MSVVSVTITMSLGGTTKSRLGTKTSASLRERNSEDEFMAAAIGDEEWLKQSVKHSKQINFDKNVSHFNLKSFDSEVYFTSLYYSRC